MINFKLNRTLHRWLSLIVSIQLIIWLGTGLYFNLMDTRKASGNENRVYVDHKGKDHQFNKQHIEFYPIKKFGNTKLSIHIKLIWILERPYYHIDFGPEYHRYQNNLSGLYDAQTGEYVRISAEQVMAIAAASYAGDGKLSTPQLMQPPFDDYIQQKNPMWQVNVDDELETVIYLDKVTGKVILHSNEDKRLKDLMMKLHFMDYGNSGGFNHWLIIVFAIGTLILSITGAVWVIKNIRR